MRRKRQMWRGLMWGGMILFFSGIAFAQGETDSLSFSKRFIHQLHLEFRPAHIFQTSPFLKEYNEKSSPINRSISPHIKYSFQPQAYSCMDRVYGGAYQGIGLAYYNFDSKELGDPLTLYLFQGGRIARFAPRLSLNYEWNFGLSYGWNPYDPSDNYYNTIIGSKANAYINMNFYMSWMLNRQFDLNTGVSLTHFSNGNTKFPNAGLNTIGLKVGVAYNFNRKSGPSLLPSEPVFVPPFPRHVSYDLVLFGAWRRKGVALDNGPLILPNAYTVLGFNFAPMYNFGYKLRAGVSLDGVYDGSANLYCEDYISGTTPEMSTPPLYKQLALGISARAEYVMPYFTVGIGLGANVLHWGGDQKALYQILALKINLSRNLFLHIGYSLHDFHDPNHLMLGFGFRFNNKYPKLR